MAERYLLDKELAQGGMGTVWVGLDSKLGRPVAVKVMAQELAQMSEAQSRFEREAMAAAQLRSTHVVQVYDYGVQEGLPFIVMELLEGESLSTRLRRLGRMDMRDVAFVVAQVAKGLKAAHKAGLVHRDLKPSNIFVATRDDAEVVKLLDFGVVKAIDQNGSSDATASGMLLGTPQYMSPEQARATRDIDHRSDLWSFGVIMFRMLTGKNPFRGESVGDVVLKICSDELPAIGDYVSDLPREFDDFFRHAFRRKREERFQTATEMAQAFFAICERAHPELKLSEHLDGSSGGFPYARPSMSGIRPPLPSDSGVQVVPPTPASSRVFEPTPHSTTVAGTQLASQLPAPRPKIGLPIAVGLGAALIITGGLLAMVWVGNETPVDRGARRTTVAAQPESDSPVTADPQSEVVAADAQPTAVDSADAAEPPRAEEGGNLAEGVDPSATPKPTGDPKRPARPSEVVSPPPRKGGTKEERPSWFE